MIFVKMTSPHARDNDIPRTCEKVYNEWEVIWSSSITTINGGWCLLILVVIRREFKTSEYDDLIGLDIIVCYKPVAYINSTTIVVYSTTIVDILLSSIVLSSDPSLVYLYL